MGNFAVTELDGMPAPRRLVRSTSAGETFITKGSQVLACYDSEDIGMRNMVLVSLTDAGVPCKEMAECMELSVTYVSMIRARAKAKGSAGLVAKRGAPSKLSPTKVTRAAEWAAKAMTYTEIGARMGVHPTTISRALHRLPTQAVLVATEPGAPEDPGAHSSDPMPELGEVLATDVAAVTDSQGPIDASATSTAGESTGADTNLARLADVEVRSQYAGAMLLHSFFDRVGAPDIFSALASGAPRRYDAPALMMSVSFGVALGASSMEGTKHLHLASAGALLGLGRFPEVRTLRPAIRALGRSGDPLALQRAFAKAMLATDDAPPELFFCDDHFVAYTGAAPVAKGYNIRRHRAEPGRDDTFVTDVFGRAICFSSAEPKGLSVSLPDILAQLVEVAGGRRVMVGFDRGGAYPKVFSAIANAGMDWVTYRRAPLVAPAVTPRRSWTVIDGRRVTCVVADETVTLGDYGPARQLSVYEHDQVVFQVITSDEAATPAALVRALRRRWSIENAFKYLEDHHGIHWLCDYGMDIAPDARLRPNPARKAARDALGEAEDGLVGAERALAQNFTDRSITPREANAASEGLHRGVEAARTALGDATDHLSGIPAKVPATTLDPDATQALPHLGARSLQMVCRLLAYNAELDLAGRLNAYLDDLDEYRGVTRNLMHLGGSIAFGASAITVTLDRPHPPRLARALSLLLEEINSTPPHLTGDGRPINYALAGS